MTKQQPDPAVTWRRRAYRVGRLAEAAGPGQPGEVHQDCPAEFIVSGASARRMEPVASPTSGSDAASASRDSAAGATTTSELTKARYSPRASAAHGRSRGRTRNWSQT